MQNKVPRIAIQMPDRYRKHFEEMARESGSSLTGLMSSLLLDLADDDRLAHGRPALPRKDVSIRVGRT